MPTSFKVSDKLYLVQHEVSKSGPPPKAVEVPTNHIVCIDCSGSMYSDIGNVREQLKKRLPKLLKEKDTISLVWFSGRGQFGTLIEAEPVATLADLKDVNSQIDRWIKCVGMTGFKEPLEEVSALTARVAKKTPGNVFSLFFMSDGCDNQWPRGDILKAVEKAAGGLASATFVEYGYYADRPLLTSMAEKAGGQLIFAQDFDKYEPAFEAAMLRKSTGAKKVEVKIPGDNIGGFAWTAANGDLTTFALEAGAANVPEDTGSIWYLSPTSVGKLQQDLVALSKDAAKADTAGQAALEAAYAAISLFSIRMKSDVVLALLKGTGDVRFIESFASCFGKQKYSEFMDAAKTAAFDTKLRFQDGFDPAKVPADDAFTVLDLLQVLASDDSNRILLDHKDFKYSKIGRGRLDAAEVLTKEELEKVAQLTAKMASEKDAKKVTALAGEIAAITASKQGLKFVADASPEGYPISSLTFNEDRPNISFNIRKTGTVDISARPHDAKIPDSFPTFIFRNYAVVKDGLVNVERLPVRLTAGTVRKLREMGMPLSVVLNPTGETLEETVTRVKKASNEREVEFLIDVKALPVINRKMVKAVSAKNLFELEFALTKSRAAQKVYKAFRDEKLPKKESASFKATYGDDGATWLKEQGFTDYSGYAPPKTVTADSTDVYMGKELTIGLKGFSSLPSMGDLKKQAAKGKYNPPGQLMSVYVKEVEDYLASADYKKGGDPAFETWVDAKAKTAITDTRRIIFEMAQTKFSIVVGQVWPSEFSSLDENTLTIDVEGQKLEGTLNQKEIEIKI